MDHTDDHLDNEPLDLDDLLPQVGEFGRYQKLMLWLVCLPACLPCGFCAFNQLFMANVPEHWCTIEELANFSSEYVRNFSRSCQRYRIDWSSLEEPSANESLPLEDCPNGWTYDTSEITSSIVIDFDLVCDKDIYPTIGLVALNLGGPIGVYSFALLNDRIGRKKSFFICLFTLLVGNIFTALSTSFWMWASSRFVVGLTIPAVYQIPFIIALELVGPNYRSFVTVMTTMFYTSGLMLLSGLTYLVRDWRWMSLATSVPFFLYFLYWFVLPESPRWLLSKGEFEKASRVLEKLARVNGKEFPIGFKQQLKQRAMLKRTRSEESLMRRGPGVRALFRTPNMRLKTCLITFNWFANAMVYVGLSYYGPALGSNEYVSFFLTSAVELPSALFCWLVIDRWGRRWPLSVCMIVSGITCIATMSLPEDSVTLTLILFLISKLTISASYLIIYPFAGELYPTQIRGIGIGFSTYVGGLGLIIMPFITHLGSEFLVLPLIIMGAVSIVGGVSGLRLPETLHHKLPQTIEEGEAFGKDFTFSDFCRCIPIRPEIDDDVDNKYEDLELSTIKEEVSEETPLETVAQRRLSKRVLTRQSSFMDTQKDGDGSMNITYWF